MTDGKEEYSSEELMRAMEMNLDGETLDELARLLRPYASAGKERFIKLDDAQHLNCYLWENSPTNKPGSWRGRELDSAEILKGLGMAERAKCLMEANGYKAVLPTGIRQDPSECGVILFTPEGQALITANQIWKEWKDKFGEKTSSGDNSSAEAAGNVYPATQATSAAEGQLSDYPLFPVGASKQIIYSGSTFDVFTPKGKWLEALTHRHERQFDFNDPAPLSCQQRFTYRDWRMAANNVPETGDKFCTYKDERLEIMMPCFNSCPPDLQTFLDAVYWYKVYTIENPGKKQYKKCLNSAMYYYRWQIASYVAWQFQRSLDLTGYSEYINRIKASSADVMSDPVGAANTFFGVNLNFFHLHNMSYSLTAVVTQHFQYRWTEKKIIAELKDEGIVEGIMVYLGELSSFDLSSTLQLLELIGKSFLGSNFRTKACQDKNQIAVVIANNPETVALFLQTLFVEGQRYIWKYLPSAAFDKEERKKLMAKTEEWKRETDEILASVSAVRTDTIADLQEKNGPAFIMDRYLGACVNVAAAEGWSKMSQVRDKAFIGNLISGNRVTLPLWEDGTRDSEELRKEKAKEEIKGHPCFDPMTFRSDMEFIFTTRDRDWLLQTLRVGEKKIKWYSLRDINVIQRDYLHKDVERTRIAFGILMMALYYVVDKYMLKRLWVKALEEEAQEDRSYPEKISAQTAIQKFWNECCCDNTDQADTKWTSDPELEVYNISDLEPSKDKNVKRKSKAKWQQQYGIDKLPTSSRRDICFAFELWCKLNFIEVPDISSARVLMDALGKKLKVASITDEKGRSCEKVFQVRATVADKYYDGSIKSYFDFTITGDVNNDKQSRVYRGLSLKADAVNALTEKWKECENGQLEERQIERFNEGLKYVMAEIVEELIPMLS